LPLALAVLLGLGLPACEDPPPEPGTPVLQIHGTKPPSIDLSLRIRYIATTEQRQCQKYTMRTTGYVPITPAWHVWPHEPSFRRSGRRYRIVPMDTTGSLPDSLQGQDLEPFRWTVNAGWGGKPRGCDFELTYITTFFRYYGSKNIEPYGYRDSTRVGDIIVSTEPEKCPHYENRFSGSKPEILCDWSNTKLECSLKRYGPEGYCLEKEIPDTVNTRIKIRYDK
jgi:hypothetical protein